MMNMTPLRFKPKERIVQEKLKDPGSFTLPFSIRKLAFRNCLCDLGATISLMPLFVARKLGFVQYKPATYPRSFADKTLRKPYGLLEDLLIKINEIEVVTLRFQEYGGACGKVYKN